MTDLRRLGQTDLRITPLGMGCWPIAGVTSVDVHEAASLATLEAAVDAGIVAPDEKVAPASADQQVVTVVSHQRVVAGPPIQAVVAVAAGEPRDQADAARHLQVVVSVLPVIVDRGVVEQVDVPVAPQRVPVRRP